MNGIIHPTVASYDWSKDSYGDIRLAELQTWQQLPETCPDGTKAALFCYLDAAFRDIREADDGHFPNNDEIYLLILAAAFDFGEWEVDRFLDVLVFEHDNPGFDCSIFDGVNVNDVRQYFKNRAHYKHAISLLKFV